jgi:ribosomal protein L15
MSMGAMLDMMQRMMGKEPGQQPGQKPGQKAGSQAGEGQTGDSNSANQDLANAGDGNKSERRIPKSAGKAGVNLPPEFQKALDAYNQSR